MSASQTVSLMFSEAEDRLVLLLGADQPGLLLTRRLTARLVNGLASILEQSSVPGSTAPADMRDGIISMEHQGAMASADAGTASEAEPAPAPAPTGQVAAHLVSNVSIAVLPTHFSVTITAAGLAPIALTLNRVDMHRIIELLTRQAGVAGWNLQIDAAWLSGDTALLTIN